MSRESPASPSSPEIQAAAPVTGPRRSRLFTWVARAICILLVVPFTFVLDRLLGVAAPSVSSALISSGGLVSHYQTIEFDITSHNNSLGLRGAEFPLQRTPGVRRILALGDSFTWGWGVSDNEAWPAVLERDLRDHGLQVEVANGGQPGAYPAVYADNAERIIPALKPDLVVIGVLQGDDIEQLRAEYAPVPGSIATRTIGVLSHALPNLTGIAKRIRTSVLQVNHVDATWRAQAQSMLKALSAAERKRYDALGPEIRDAFESGRLNPFLVNIGVRHPEYFIDATREAGLAEPSEALAASLRRMVALARANGSRALVVSIPYPVYVSRAGLNHQRRLGFQLEDGMVNSEVPDRAIREASERAGLKCATATARFRDESARRELFFPVDGHLNAAGHRLLAEQLRPVIEELLKPSP